MNNKKSLSLSIPLLITLLLLFLSCKNRPTILEPITQETSEGEWTIPGDKEVQHEVIVKEVLQASNYTYLNVEEKSNLFWIAVPKADIKVGEKYNYKGGLKMENFKSKDHDRTFEELYLVSSLQGDQSNPVSPGINMSPTSTDQGPLEVIEQIEGGTSLKSLFSDPEKYNGKKIKVKGKCVKINIQILGKNWIHLQDGTENDEGSILDLTITSDEEVNVGDVVTMEGIIVLDKDFGAGYRYDVIMEEAVVIK